MRKTFSAAGLVLVISLLLAQTRFHKAKAQDTPLTAALPADVVDQIMGLIGQGRIDDGIALMEGLNSQPDLRQGARNRLIHLKDEQGAYRGYEVAAVQRFTSQFQTLDVLAYYDEQPVLFRFHFYRPQMQAGTKWMVLGFQITTAVQEITEQLKDTPLDYVGQKK